MQVNAPPGSSAEPAAAAVSAPPLAPLHSVAAPLGVTPPANQPTTSGGKGCITALIVTLVIIAVVGFAIIGGMIYLAHKVKNKVQEYAKEVQHIGDTLPQPDQKPRVDFSDVPGSFKIGEQLAAACPEAAAATDTTKDTARIPLKEGLTWVNAWHRFNGDVEVVNKLTTVAANQIETTSSGLAFNGDKAVQGNQLDTSRAVCRTDLEGASEYYTEYRASLPHIIPHTTTFSMSRKTFDELKTTGKTTLTYQQFFPISGRALPGPRTAELTRVEAEDVNYPVILNGQPTNLPVIHAQGHFHFTGEDKVKSLWTDPSVLDGDGEIFVLEDRTNPMMLQFGFGPIFKIRVVNITFPEDKPKPQIEDQLAKQKKAVIYGIYFDFNQATIKKESQPVLQEIADAMKNNPDWVLTVNGHTDNIGGDQYNLELSERRAAAVKKALVEQYAIAPERMTTGGLGASSPVDTNDTLEGRARNRRVELIRQ